MSNIRDKQKQQRAKVARAAAYLHMENSIQAARKQKDWKPTFSPNSELKIRVMKMYLKNIEPNLDEETARKKAEMIFTKNRIEMNRILDVAVKEYSDEVKEIKKKFEEEHPYIIDTKTGISLADEWIKINKNNDRDDEEER